MPSLHTCSLDASLKLEGSKFMMLVIKAMYIRNFCRGLLSLKLVLQGLAFFQASRKVCFAHLSLLTDVEGVDCSSYIEGWLSLLLEVSVLDFLIDVEGVDCSSYIEGWLSMLLEVSALGIFFGSSS